MFYLPDTVVDDAPSPSVFHREARWICQIKRNHAVVHVAAEVNSDRNSALRAEIAPNPHVDQRIAFQHEMVDPLRRAFCLHESHRVMARIAVQKNEAKLPAGKA